MKGIVRMISALFLIGAFLVPQLAFASGQEDSIPLDAEHFPDAAFRSCMAEQADTDADGQLSADERSAVVRIDVADKEISSLAGIEFFPQITALACGSNSIKALNLSKNSELTRIEAQKNPLEDLQLGKASRLLHLNVSATKVRKLDLAQAPNLVFLACGSPSLSALDLSALKKLAVLDARGCTALRTVTPGKHSLIAAHGTADMAIKVDPDKQMPYLLDLDSDETTFDLAALDPSFADGKVSKLDGGAQISGTKLKKLAPGQHLSYIYKDGLSVPCKVDVVSGNYWTEPLSLDGWSVGQEPNEPSAEAKHGKVTFTYGTPDGPFSENVPTQAGSYVVRATVPAGEDYEELSAEEPFEISDEPGASDTPDTPEPEPSSLTATYGDLLSSVELPTGFAWDDPDSPVGDVGINKFPVTFTLSGAEPVPMTLSVRVLPKEGDTLEISPITNEYEANHIVIRNGDQTLVKGTDYFITNSVEEDEVTVIIHFMGNYTGEVVRTFTFDLENAWIIPLRMTGWTYGEEPHLPEAEAKYGETVFAYAKVDNPDADGGGQPGEFTTKVPEAAGTYVVRATVPKTSYYTGLSDEKTFVIAKAQPSYTLPQGLQTVYGTLLQAVALPTGFSFDNPQQAVGDVGERAYPGKFTPADTANYETAAVQIQLKVNPKNGANFTVDRITNETQLQNPVVRDGNTVLVRDRDYTVTVTRNGYQYTLTIKFIGNYTGQLVRTYNMTQQSGGSGTTLTTTGGSGGGTAPRTDDSANLEGNLFLAILSAATALAMVFWLWLDHRRALHSR